MTRASHITATTVSKSLLSQNRNNGNGGSCPQWMRTLEEKYQKLHKKIAEDTYMGNGRFTSSAGRTLYDARLSRALLRYKHLGLQKPTSKSRSTSKSVNINNTNETCDTQYENPTQQNQYLNNKVTIDMDNEGVKNCQEDSNYRSMSQINCQDCKHNSVEEVTSHDDSFEALHDYDSENNSVDGDRHKRNKELHTPVADDCDTTVISSDTSKIELNSNRDQMNANKYCRRTLKTSVSRASKVTSRSCPANLQSKTLERASQKHYVLSSRSKSANMNAKMFTPMSAEAKHAITETIHEMSQVIPERTQDFIPSRGRSCVRTWAMSKKAKGSFDIRKVLKSAPQCLDDVHSDGINLLEGHSEDGNYSCHSFSTTISEDEQRMNSRLPDILIGSARDRNALRNSSYRLPGIGKYDIVQDDPIFEITPPGFDSRYNNVQVVEERESETPPPDIRQRAIDKCSDWLNKYNK